MIEALVDRSDYSALEDYVYLNQASLGLIGQPAVQSMHQFLDDVARHGNLKMTDEEEAGFFDSLRMRGAKILNCSPDQLAILASASELLGQLPLMIRPKPGSSILAVSSDFPAVTRPWIRYASENNCSLRFVDDVATENLTEKLIESLDEQTSVVAVSSVQFSTGSAVDVPRLRAVSADIGASLVLDVTQAAGILKMDAGNWEADAVVCSGYKWLGGHGGVAIASVSPSLLQMIPPLPGWMGTSNPFDFDATKLGFAAGARRLTQSTMSYISIKGLTTAIDRITQLNQGQVEAHSRRLSHKLIDSARPCGWMPFRSMEDPSASPHIVALMNPKLGVERAVEKLRSNRIVTGARNGRIRVSLAPYNNGDDIDTLINVLNSTQ